jgi:hypothetical protein
MARAVWSHPPPGLAGATISRRRIWASAGFAARAKAAAEAVVSSVRRSIDSIGASSA